MPTVRALCVGLLLLATSLAAASASADAAPMELTVPRIAAMSLAHVKLELLRRGVACGACTADQHFREHLEGAVRDDADHAAHQAAEQQVWEHRAAMSESARMFGEAHAKHAAEMNGDL
jgi:hypothetical protein